MGLVGHDGVCLGELVEGEDLGLALDAQRVGTVADLGEVDVAGLHGRDLGGAGIELGGLDGDANLIEVALVDGGVQGGGGAQVGHEGDAQGNRVIGGRGGRGGSLGRSGGGARAAAANETEAGSGRTETADLQERATGHLGGIELLHDRFLSLCVDEDVVLLFLSGARPR